VTALSSARKNIRHSSGDMIQIEEWLDWWKLSEPWSRSAGYKEPNDHNLDGTKLQLDCEI